MIYRFAAAAVFLSASCLTAVAVEAPTAWRDPDTGCVYLITPQGGIGPRYKRDGALDCPDADASSRLADDAARGFSRGLDALQREMERLKDRFRDEPPAERMRGDI